MSIVGFRLELGGDVSSFIPSVQAQMQSAFAAQAGVDPSAVELTISPGSIIADVRIETYAVMAASVQSAMARATSSPSSATAMLASVTGISIVVLAVVTLPTIADVPPPPPPSPSPPPPVSPLFMSTGASAVETSGSTGIIMGVIFGVIIFFVLVLVSMHRRLKGLWRGSGGASPPTIQIVDPAVTRSLATSCFMEIYNQPESRPDQLYAQMTSDCHRLPERRAARYSRIVSS